MPGERLSMRKIWEVVPEWDGVWNFDRHRPDPGSQPKFAKTAHDLCIEICYGPRSKHYGFDFAFARLQPESMIDKIEVNLETLTPVRARLFNADKPPGPSLICHSERPK